jgi:sugar O-acyltransferase (sialic acid O-acetyltransferase NeuD family)
MPSVLVDRRTDLEAFLPITAPDNLAETLSGGFVVAIGGQLGRDRADISRDLMRRGMEPLTAIHPRSTIAETAIIGLGAQLLMGACISEEASLGNWCIINTNASVDHDCRLGDGVHVMPGAAIAGEVQIGDYATIGTNATILPRIKIGEGAMIGAGAVVTKDVAEGQTVVGVPARPL